jgi:glucose-1-phosphate thymidylyltransferase
VLEYKGKWLDPGKFDDWLEANRYLLETDLDERQESEVDSSVKISGKVSIGLNCKISNSKIVGPSIIGDNVEIKDSSIGPFASISDDCVIDKSQIENSVLMNGAKVLNIKSTIDTSLFGPGSEFTDVAERDSSISLFIGEKSKIEI